MILNPSQQLGAPVFTAEIRPYRSLGPQGFRTLMLLLCVASAIVGLPFALLGFWPVVGFLALDCLGVYVAFRLSYRQGLAVEILELTPVRLLLRKIAPSGIGREWRFNPLWTRLDREIDQEFGMQSLSLNSYGQRVIIARDLSPLERESLAEALGHALLDIKRGF